MRRRSRLERAATGLGCPRPPFFPEPSLSSLLPPSGSRRPPFFLLVDVICCYAIFFPIIWSIRNLREASKTDGKAARNLRKLTLFKQFYVVVVGYLYFTRIVVSARSAELDYRYRWLGTAAVEGANLAFYRFMFYNFQPVERNPYLYIGDEEEEEAAGVLEMEDAFEL